MSAHESKSPKKSAIKIACWTIVGTILGLFLYCVNSLIDQTNSSNKQRADVMVECYKKAGRDNKPYEYRNGQCILVIGTEAK